MTFARFKYRRDEAADWADKNPVLLEGEPGFESDTRKLKIGDGVHAWNDLEYISGGAGLDEQALLDHINNATPHPAYDDGPSFVLKYQNAKV